MKRDEAIDIIRDTYHTDIELQALEVLIPELAESEDERIRKALYEFISDTLGDEFDGYDFNKREALAYLERQKDIEDRWIEDRGQCFWNGVEEGKMLAEKQKEQKPAEWSEELKNELAKKHLDGYIMGREDTMREMKDFIESHFNCEKAKGPNPPAINIPTWTPPCYNGGPCTNPFKDCINCPRANVVITPNTSSGTSTATLHGNTSATDGKEHNPSFTD